eukprot:TRINITY_DN11196_c1_g1_i1.p1 TRINITY_DN11196_c1_g1~~TRINITY_DN11196_c1_g1_i1.p1  ORF type:complete len:281 (-),score=66.57 TRINITY_DN11196_c1_g1_i1:195-1037(-)
MTWKEDGSGKVKVSGSEVEHSGDRGKANAIWSESGSGYWEFKVSGQSGAWVGICSPDKFGPGYGIKGLFYGGPGNLSDGGSLAKGSWGPKFGDGDVIGMRVEHTADRTLVAFSKNGEGLGVAFDIQGLAGGKDMCPAVSLESTGQKVCLTSGNMPPASAMEKSTAVKPGVEGQWTGRFSFSIKKEGEHWIIGSRVANSMGCDVQVGSDGKLKPGHIIGTQMMPSPELYELEKEVQGIMSSLQEWKRDGDKLVLVHGKGEEMLSPAAGPGPANKDDINWIK